MKTILSLITLTSLTAFAGPTVFKVKGMHCSGCAAMVKKSVCENEEIKKAYGGCTTKIIDEKNEIGEVTFAAAGSEAIDKTKIQTLLTATDDGYKIIDEPSQATAEALSAKASDTQPAKAHHTKSKKK